MSTVTCTYAGAIGRMPSSFVMLNTKCQFTDIKSMINLCYYIFDLIIIKTALNSNNMYI